MRSDLEEQLVRGAIAEQNVTGLLAIERSLRLQVASKDAEIQRLRAALEKAEPMLAAAAYTEQSSPPYQQGRACGALLAVRDALAKRDPEQRGPKEG